MTFRFTGEIEELNETTRALADGSFVRLADGVTHYELAGPVDARVVVLVHGFSVPYFIFDPTFEFLATSGFRVLRYDLLGRGWSDRPNLPNNIDLFVRQLYGLLEALQIASPVTLLGLSMGGPISAVFTVQHPERVARNVLIDPSGTHPVQLGPLKAISLPLIGELSLGLFGRERLVKSIASDFFDASLVEHFQDRYREQMRFAGFKSAMLSTLRTGMLGDFSGVYRSLAALAKPTLLLWGRQDTTVPFLHSADLLKIIPHAEFHPIEQSSHIPHYEKPGQVNQLLLDFLRST